jgi:hypothetical protein
MDQGSRIFTTNTPGAMNQARSAGAAPEALQRLSAFFQQLLGAEDGRGRRAARQRRVVRCPRGEHQGLLPG